MAVTDQSLQENPDLSDEAYASEIDIASLLKSNEHVLPKPDPAWRKSMISLAEAQMRHDRPADAIPSLVMLCKTDESDHYASRLLALALVKTDRWQEAQTILDRLAGHKPQPNTPLTRAWNKLYRFADIFWKLSVALAQYGAKKVRDKLG